MSIISLPHFLPFPAAADTQCLLLFYSSFNSFNFSQCTMSQQYGVFHARVACAERWQRMRKSHHHRGNHSPVAAVDSFRAHTHTL